MEDLQKILGNVRSEKFGDQILKVILVDDSRFSSRQFLEDVSSPDSDEGKSRKRKATEKKSKSSKNEKSTESENTEVPLSKKSKSSKGSPISAISLTMSEEISLDLSVDDDEDVSELLSPVWNTTSTSSEANRSRSSSHSPQNTSTSPKSMVSLSPCSFPSSVNSEKSEKSVKLDVPSDDEVPSFDLGVSFAETTSRKQSEDVEDISSDGF